MKTTTTTTATIRSQQRQRIVRSLIAFSTTTTSISTRKKYTCIIFITVLLLSASTILIHHHFQYILTTILQRIDDYNEYYEQQQYTVSNISQYRNSYTYSIIHDNPNNHLTLRYDYTNLERLSPLAQLIEKIQHDCSSASSSTSTSSNTDDSSTAIQQRNVQLLYKHRNFAGMGSAIHMYSTAICNTIEYNTYNTTYHKARLRTMGEWIFYDNELCIQQQEEDAKLIQQQYQLQRIQNNDSTPSNRTGRIFSTSTTTTSQYYDSSMSCYFPQAEPICKGDMIRGQEPEYIPITDIIGNIDTDSRTCPQTTQVYSTPVIRAATTEYLFTRVSSLVVLEAKRQLNVLFYNNPITNYTIPKNLITVHIRWGDKYIEMGLVSIEHYISAVQQIVDRRRTEQEQKNHNNDAYNDQVVHILLCTEDPEAVQQFMDHKPHHWVVHLDQYYVEMLPSRQKIGNVINANLGHTINFKGHNGLIALGSLLVAMESNDYILTTGSNWSRLINEIRMNIINPRCNDCSTMIDLLPGEY